MLGGTRRLWPSIAAYLLAEQHRAHRQGDMARVWVIRRMRARIQVRAIQEREESLLTGEPIIPLSDKDALAEIMVERDEVIEELEQCRQWLRTPRAQELQQALSIIDEYTGFWQSRAQQ